MQWYRGLIKTGTGMLTAFFVAAILLCGYGLVSKSVNSNIFFIFMLVDIVFCMIIAFDFYHAFRNYEVCSSD
jgi:hypothetical protein